MPVPTTFAAIAPSPGVIPGAAITIIAGSAFMVISSFTNIQVGEGPSGLAGPTTIIDGTPFIVVPGPTDVLAAASASDSLFSPLGDHNSD